MKTNTATKTKTAKTKTKSAANKKAPAAKKKAPAAPKKVAAPKKAPAAPPKKMAPRADYGAPIDGFFTKQPPELRAVLEELRALIESAAPEATSQLKWGMPFFELRGELLCAIAGFKSHANLILPGPPGTYRDPDGLLEGESKMGRHLKMRSVAELPRETIRGWLKTSISRVQR